MRLGKTAKEALHDTVRRALSGPCVVTVPARSRAMVYRMFEGVTPHMEEYGAVARPHMLSWALPNGSLIRIAHHDSDATV